MIPWLPVGFDEALKITLETVRPLGKEVVPLEQSTGRVVADSMVSSVNSPSIDASLKDGYAVLSADLDGAGPDQPVALPLMDSCSAAGGGKPCRLVPGAAMRILTGARIPEGADAVLSEEFADLYDGRISANAVAEPGRNIMPRGSDVQKGDCVVQKGLRVSPGLAGIMAASGFSEVPVYKRPKVAILATGDEVVAPGKPLAEGKLYASNMVTLSAFCSRLGMDTALVTAKDDPAVIKKALETAFESCDAVVTSGGAWTGDRDLVARILSDLGWQKAFHRIRIGPGKAVGFGMRKGTPVFILPGGPPSNLMGFLQIALPGLERLSGCLKPGLPKLPAVMAAELNWGPRDWTRFFYGKTALGEQGLEFEPLKSRARLQCMADATAVAVIPEGRESLAKGETALIQVLSL